MSRLIDREPSRETLYPVDIPRARVAAPDGPQGSGHALLLLRAAGGIAREGGLRDREGEQAPGGEQVILETIGARRPPSRGALWLTDRVEKRRVCRPADDGEVERTKSRALQRQHWAGVLKDPSYSMDRSIAAEELRRIDREMLAK